MKCRPIIIIRATQKKMMSCPVSITEVGYHVSSSLVFSGQPRVENGHSPELNQVSSTSGSWTHSPLGFSAVTPGLARETTGLPLLKSSSPFDSFGPDAGYQAGI